LGAEAVGVFEAEGFEIAGGLVGKDEGLGGDAEFEGVEAGSGFAFGVRGPVDFFALARLAAICFGDAID